MRSPQIFSRCAHYLTYFFCKSTDRLDGHLEMSKIGLLYRTKFITDLLLKFITFLKKMLNVILNEICSKIDAIHLSSLSLSLSPHFFRFS